MEPRERESERGFGLGCQFGGGLFLRAFLSGAVSEAGRRPQDGEFSPAEDNRSISHLGRSRQLSRVSCIHTYNTVEQQSTK